MESEKYPHLTQVCRACLSSGRQLRLIVDKDKTFETLFRKCTSVKLNELPLPLKFCEQCIKLLHVWRNFQSLCIYSQNKLKTIVYSIENRALEDSPREVKHNVSFATEYPLASTESPSKQRLTNDKCCYVEECYLEQKKVEPKTKDQSKEEQKPGMANVEESEEPTTVDPILKKSPFQSIERKLYHCNFCDKSYKSKVSLQIHEFRHKGLKPFKCEICEQTFTKEIELKMHTFNVHVGLPSIECAKDAAGDILESTFQKPEVPCIIDDPMPIQSIFINPHEQDSSIEAFSTNSGAGTLSKFMCTICNKSYSTKENLQIHEYTHSGIKPFKCTFCDKSFTREIALKVHLAMHTETKNYRCDECGKEFRTSIFLNRHKQTHLTSRLLKCEYCFNNFQTPAELNTHIRSHTGDKPYLCSTCGKQFRQSSHLVTHQRTQHIGEKPYTCTICEKCFDQADDLTAHQRVHIEEPLLSCNYCDKGFKLQSALNTHLRMHSLYSCSMCDKKFALAKSLERHALMHQK